ncbi:MAG TPA: glycoside hydrolase family 30 beta sandwich domain-containing protein [Terracidiphilus sp.]|nr:glycoside hydrolase family 30 beta sandwich domain-containing protein [Terracidiphilus sp.]
MTLKTRREFLQNVARAAAVSALSQVPLLRSQPIETLRPVRAWMTSGAQRFASFEAPRWQKAAVSASRDIRIDPTSRRQTVLGFGAAFTDATCYLFSQLPDQGRRELIDEFFGPNGLRLSVARTCIGSSDYSRGVYSFDDSSEPDPELKHFSIEHDRAYILPSLRAARELNPELFLFSSPWSPPGWMKAGGSMLGGSMRKAYFAPYAQYFVRFLEAYAAEGVKIDAITVQNEPDTDQDGKMPACLWGQEYEMDFIQSFLGPALEHASLDTKIWLLDHNYNLWGRALDELSDPGVNKYVDGVAWHGYAGAVDAMTRVHQAFPQKSAYWTEGGPDFTKQDYTTDWSTWSQTFTGVLRNWGRCLVGWNLALDEQGKPNVGPFSCGGVVTIDSRTQRLTRSGQYWAFAHYSKAIRRYARILASHGQLAGVEHVALENPDGSRVLIITNRSEARTVDCGLDSSTLQIHMPGDSVVTLVW